MEALRGGGATHVVLVGGYKHQKLAGRADELLVNERWAETNMVRSLMVAAPILAREPAIVSYADIVYGADTIRALANARGGLVIAYDTRWRDLWELRFERPEEDAETFKIDNGRITEIGGKARTTEGIEGQYMGLLRFEPAAWNAVERELDTLTDAQKDKLDMTSLLARLIRAGVEIRGMPISGGWCEADSDTDLAAYEQRLARSERWSHDWRVDA
jgi:choline kinase